MCFTVSLKSDLKKTQKRFNAKFAEPKGMKPIFYSNAFSFPKHPVITQNEPDAIQLFNWGLIPHWAKDEEAAKSIRTKTGNARAETITEKPSFRGSAKSKRCLVLIDGFYEWREYKGKKYPYYIYMKNEEPFALGGLWDEWTNQNSGELIHTFSIITCEANPLLAKIHNTKKRMPVILEKEDEMKWIDPNLPVEEFGKILDPFKEKLEAHTVSKLVTARGVERNVPEVIEEFKFSELPEL